MSGKSTEAGFTLVELLAVLILIGVLAAVALPRLSLFSGFSQDGWREQTMAGLRLAQASAVGHRRLVCADFDAGRLQLRLASSNPASSCDAAFEGPMGSSVGSLFGSEAAQGLAVSPAGAIYFQPSGRVTRDAAGTQVAARRLSATGVADIVVHGESGHVE